MIKHLKDDKWFKQQQSLLLWMANTKYGRDLLSIPKDYGRIIDITKQHVTWLADIQKDKIIKVSNFKSRAPYGKVIRENWKEFQEYAKEYYRIFYRKPILFPVIPVLGFAFTVSTFFPDADPETATVDGRVGRSVVTEAWTTIRTSAGNSVQDAETSGRSAWIQTSTTTDQFNEMWRGIYLFDTSSIPDTDTIDSAIWSLMTVDRARTLLSTTNVRLTTSNPASDTSLVTGDYANVGTAAIATDVAWDSFTNEVYNDITLTDLTVISKTGVTKLGTRMQADADDAQPTWGSDDQIYIQPYLADNAGTTKDPKLAVTHSAAAVVAAVNHWLLMGV